MQISNHIAKGRALFDANPDSVLFVTSQLRPRELKMADGLRRLGWKVGLVYYKWTPFEPDQYFDFAIEVPSAEGAHLAAEQLHPRVTHVFSGAIDDFVLSFCRKKPSPVVIDLNDVFAPSLFNYCQERFEPTREALALADGFCARDLQVKRAQRIDGFVLPPQRLFFPEYCWNQQPIPEKSAAELQEDEVHVVSVGTFSLETQGMYDSCYLHLARLLVEQQIHFHIYPHWMYRRDHAGSPHANFNTDFADFIALGKATPYLHLHESLPIDELASVLPRYDFGIVSGGAKELGQKLNFYHPAYLETCYSGRISDYLEAHLPILINQEVKFDYWLLKRLGACVDLKGLLQPGFKQELLDLKRSFQLRKTMKSAADKFSVFRNSKRLALYYNKIISDGMTMHHFQKASPMAIPVASSDIATLTAPSQSSAIEATSGDSSYPPYGKYLPRQLIAVAPRIARLVLPYRAIRLLESRLHDALEKSCILSSVQRKLESLEQERGELHAQVAGLEQERGGLHAQVAGLEQERDELHAQVAGLEHERGELHAQVAGLEQERGEVHGRVAGLEQERGELHGRVAGLEQERGELHARVAGLEQERGELHGRVAGLEQERGELHARVAGLEQERGELHAQAVSSAQSIHLLSNEKFALQQEHRLGNQPIHELAGLLNWPEVLDDAARSNGFSELVRVLRLFSSQASVIDTPSACWDALATKNFDQLLNAGYANFKRTIGLNYFNFLVQKGDPQIAALESLLPIEIIERCQERAHDIPDDATLPWSGQFTYRYFVLLLWEFARKVDVKNYLQTLSEPKEGNPIAVPTDDRIATQDLANSVIEYYSMAEAVRFENIGNVLEIGGGYGRNSYVILANNPQIRVTMVDIPPALFIAQRYLTSVFKDRKIFKVREFVAFEDVRLEMEDCSVVFLMPHQLALLPENSFDLGLNISSFGEMAMDQIHWYFDQLARLVSGHFYMKQWQVSRNVFDGTVLEEKDYPFPTQWAQVFSRTCRVQEQFFEAMYQARKG